MYKIECKLTLMGAYQVECILKKNNSTFPVVEMQYRFSNITDEGIVTLTTKDVATYRWLLLEVSKIVDVIIDELKRKEDDEKDELY